MSVATVSWQPSADKRVANYEAQYLDPITEAWTVIGITVDPSIDTTGLQSGEYQFRVRSIDFAGRTSEWLVSSLTNVNAADDEPDNVTGFNINILGDFATLSWNPVSSLNLDHYIIRYSPVLTGATWNTASLLQDGILSTNIQLTALTGSFLIKAVSTTGVESSVEAIISSNVAGLTSFNEVLQYSGAPSWIGTMVNVSASGGELTLVSGDHVSDWTQVSAVLNVAHGLSGYVSSGTFTPAIIDLSEVYTSRVTASVNAFGLNAATFMINWTTLSLVTTLVGNDPGGWSVLLE
ncbi:hypothetical protein GP486_008671, partial [Trichoglossum hirsutum]